VLLSHGGGGRASHLFVGSVFGRLAAAAHPRQDAAVLPRPAGRIAVSTDSFVVTPCEFPGGSLGTLAACGTLNDVAVMGARPEWLTAAFIIEEGLPVDLLTRMVTDLQRAADEAGVPVVAADTKVVGRGAADGLFITTTGGGAVRDDAAVGSDRAFPGDAVILSGTIGDHGLAVMAARAALPLEPPIESDCACIAPLAHLLQDAAGPAVHCMRDPTRGGLAAALNEIAADSAVTIRVYEDLLPVRRTVREACELLGLDPAHAANEGKLIAVVSADAAPSALEALRSHPLGREATLIGEVADRSDGQVRLATAFGAERVLDMPSGELLPRIC